MSYDNNIPAISFIRIGNSLIDYNNYSDFDNIKSLNSMDNTLSDIVSVIDKD